MYKNSIKPVIDFVLAMFIFCVILPLFLIIAIVLYVQGISPFFLQERLGENSEIFKIIKFKTMSENKDNKGNLLPDDVRLTSFGRILRNTSLDELPQLINVLKGEMSLVGPRPLLPYYQDLYNDFQTQRNNVRPGITGWAQVNGRNAVPWASRFEMDVWYTQNISFFLDLKILILTVRQLLVLKNIRPGEGITQDFEGNL